MRALRLTRVRGVSTAPYSWRREGVSTCEREAEGVKLPAWEGLRRILTLSYNAVLAVAAGGRSDS